MTRFGIHALAGFMYALAALSLYGQEQRISPAITVNSAASATKSPPAIGNSFLVRSYQGKVSCLDYSPEVTGSPIFINDCAIAHSIRVEELNDGRHTVVLHAGTKLIGAQIGFLSRQRQREPLQLRRTAVQANPCWCCRILWSPIMSATVAGNQMKANQQFALDGDSIISHPLSMPESRRSRIPYWSSKCKMREEQGKVPWFWDSRDFADNEFWEFQSSDGSGRDATSGFVRVSTSIELAAALQNATSGTVIKVADSNLSLNVFPSIAITAPRVTVRGDRRGTNLGPELASVLINRKPITCLTFMLTTPASRASACVDPAGARPATHTVGSEVPKFPCSQMAYL